MSRLTGADAYGLMEAYNNVYAPQELTEEQVWEEVENWVNSLLEEGYDLSDYTWEEMYKDYLQLQEVDFSGKQVGALNRAQNPLKPPTKGKVDFSGKGVADLNRRQLSLPLADEYIKEATPAPRPTLKGAGGDNQLYQNRLGAFVQGAQAVKSGSRVRPTLKGAGGDNQLYQNRLGAFVQGAQAVKAQKYKSSSDGKTYANYKDAKAAHDSRLKSLAATQAASRGGSGGSETSTTPPTRTPAAAPAKVSPTPTKPSLGPTGKPLVGGIERRTPTRAEMGSAKAYRTPAATTGTLGAATADATKPAAFGSTSTAPEVKAPNTAAAKTTPTPVTPKPNLQQSIKASRGLPTVSSSYEYDAYDLVLEYLLSQGHAETVEEAHYVMLEMDAETIGTIVEAASDQSDKQIDKGVKTTYKAQNVLDNQHQGRSKGLNKLPRGEREEKAKRMSGRLKNRRDDLFGERNKREDSRRDELKKMLGL